MTVIISIKCDNSDVLVPIHSTNAKKGDFMKLISTERKQLCDH